MVVRICVYVMTYISLLIPGMPTLSRCLPQKRLHRCLIETENHEEVIHFPIGGSLGNLDICEDVLTFSPSPLAWDVVTVPTEPRRLEKEITSTFHIRARQFIATYSRRVVTPNGSLVTESYPKWLKHSG